MSLTTKFIARIVAPTVVFIAAAVGISGCFKGEPKPSEKVVQDAEAARLAALIAAAKAESLEKIAALTLNGGKPPPSSASPSPAPSTDSIPVIDGRNMTPITLQDGQCVTARWIGGMPEASNLSLLKFTGPGYVDAPVQDITNYKVLFHVVKICTDGGQVRLFNRASP